MTGSCEVRESSDDAAPLPVWSASTFDYFLSNHLPTTLSSSYLVYSYVDFTSFQNSDLLFLHPPLLSKRYINCNHERPRRGDRRDGQAGNGQDNTCQTLDGCVARGMLQAWIQPQPICLEVSRAASR